MINIGLIGYGCVGQGFYRIIKDKQLPVTVSKICIKNKDKERKEKLNFTFFPEEIIHDDSIRIIVEAIDDAEAALSFAIAALKQGKSLITANKKMVAENLPLLKKIEEENGGNLLFEAAVCGGIPVMQLLKSYYKNEKILSIEGILNGSTNYILTRMSAEKVSYHDALLEAQQKGFAEADPTLDVEGYDAANKLSILSHEAFYQYLHPNDVSRSGISSVKIVDIEAATKNSKKIKLVAKLFYENGNLAASVKPQLLNNTHPLYHVDDEYNAVVIEGEYSGKQILYGKGAGSFPTGLAVAGDLLEVLKTKKALALV